MILASEAHAALRALPIAPIPATPALILAPHPDDESLGLGGLIASQCARGTPPFVLILTDGAGSHPHSRHYPPPRLRALREQEARDAVHALGLPPDRIAFLGLPDTASPMHGPAFDAAVAAVATLLQRHALDEVLATWEHDPHCDHLSAHRIAAAAAAIAGVRHRAYPVWGWTLPPDTPLPALPTGCRIDIAAHLPAKRRAIAAHRSQHGALIGDDPAGFQLPPGFLALFDTPHETLLDVPRGSAA